jgi:hypothetical protein
MCSGRLTRRSSPVIALTGLIASAMWTGSAQAMDQRLRGAWAASASDCSRLLQTRGGAWSFRPKTNQFEQAYIISGNKVMSPAGSCSIARASQAKDKSELRLTCKNSVSYMTMDVRVTLQSDTQMTYGYTGDAVLDVSYVKCAR